MLWEWSKPNTQFELETDKKHALQLVMQSTMLSMSEFPQFCYAKLLFHFSPSLSALPPPVFITNIIGHLNPASPRVCGYLASQLSTPHLLLTLFQ